MRRRSNTALHRTPPVGASLQGRLAVQSVPPVSATVGPHDMAETLVGGTRKCPVMVNIWWSWHSVTFSFFMWHPCGVAVGPLVMLSKPFNVRNEVIQAIGLGFLLPSSLSHCPCSYSGCGKSDSRCACGPTLRCAERHRWGYENMEMTKNLCQKSKNRVFSCSFSLCGG